MPGSFFRSFRGPYAENDDGIWGSMEDNHNQNIWLIYYLYRLHATSYPWVHQQWFKTFDHQA